MNEAPYNANVQTGYLDADDGSVKQTLILEVTEDELRALVRDLKLVLSCVDPDPFNPILVYPIAARDRLLKLVSTLKETLP